MASKIASSIRGNSFTSFNDHFKNLTPISPVVEDPSNHVFIWENRMDDSKAGAAASGVEIRQRTYSYTSQGDSNYILVVYKVQNVGASIISNYHLGLFADFDVSRIGEFDNCRYRPDRNWAM